MSRMASTKSSQLTQMTKLAHMALTSSPVGTAAGAVAHLGHSMTNSLRGYNTIRHQSFPSDDDPLHFSRNFIVRHDS